MPRFAIEITAEGPLIRVFAGAPEVYADEAGPAFSGEALVDTGAGMSAISPAVVAMSKPPQVGVEIVARSGGAVGTYPTYLVRIKPCAVGGEWVDVEAVAIQPASPGVDLILGRDVLRRMILYWDGPVGIAWLEQ